MLYRSNAFSLFTIALLLSAVTAILIYGNWSSLSETVPMTTTSLRWLTLFALALSSQVLLGYALWRLLRKRQKSVVQTEVLHSIVHEFQTPITAIRMAADILDSPIARNQPERTEKYIRIIREETERLQHQVETMLTLARADRNTLILNPEPVRIHHLLRSIADRHGSYLHLNLLGADPHLLADRLHLTNVLYNLLDNAIKYSADEPEITVQTKTSSDGLTITVRDRGVGIAPNLMPKIFQPFFRVHDRNQPSVKGFGLGLSYVQRIVQAHNWSIWVKSELGQGSEFIIQIPPTSLLPASTQTEAVLQKQTA
ncbi:HAMP domain-containing histidine kinase [Spirosoma taeanense]|uniref:histidine kinase n=1 Tax=Spirosoma taeanense TaxID=2735870 RepID=A0A6M5Y7S1_9BACT|nr:HAMP domain-containing sensor histidine kinase [Spirosoma taeanense]QJW89534.1 HAMP domain-containing histidine kinase [Spirosoma taeanense]